MARAHSIWIAKVGASGPIMASFTVKHELVTAVSRGYPKNLQILKFPDGASYSTGLDRSSEAVDVTEEILKLAIDAD